MSRPRYKWTEEQIKQIVDLRRSGESVEAISGVVGISFSTVRLKLREMGVSCAPRSRVGRPGNDLSWDERLFESYADRKARLAKDKAKLGGAL